MTRSERVGGGGDQSASERSLGQQRCLMLASQSMGSEEMSSSGSASSLLQIESNITCTSTRHTCTTPPVTLHPPQSTCQPPSLHMKCITVSLHHLPSITLLVPSLLTSCLAASAGFLPHLDAPLPASCHMPLLHSPPHSPPQLTLLLSQLDSLLSSPPRQRRHLQSLTKAFLRTSEALQRTYLHTPYYLLARL